MNKIRRVVARSHNYSFEGNFIGWTKVDEKIYALIESPRGEVKGFSPVGSIYSIEFLGETTR